MNYLKSVIVSVCILLSGIMLTLLLSPLIRYNITISKIKEAEIYFSKGDLTNGIRTIETYQTWAAHYPYALKKMYGLLIQTALSMNDYDSAKNLADKIATGLPVMYRKSNFISSFIEAKVNSLHINDGYGPDFNNAGYEFIAASLVSKKNVALLSRFKEDLAKKDKNHPMLARLSLKEEESRREEQEDLALVSPSYTAEKAVSRWGIVKTPGLAIIKPKTEGQIIIPLGSFVEVNKSFNSGENALTECNVIMPGGQKYLADFETNDLEIHSGSLAASDFNLKSLVSRRSRILHKISMQTAKDAKKPKPAINIPSKDAFLKAEKDVADYMKKSEELQTKRDQAVGAARMSFTEKLQALKGQESALVRALEIASKQYKTDEANMMSSTKDQKSPELIELNKELGEIETALAAYVRN